MKLTVKDIDVILKALYQYMDKVLEEMRATRTYDIPFALERVKPIIEAEPRRYGCSVCKRLSWYESNYCPHCGAKMEGAEE